MPNAPSADSDHNGNPLPLNLEAEPAATEQPWPEDGTAAPLAQHSFAVRLDDLPASARPRERLMELGAAALSAGELLAILLGTGQTNRLSALDLGQQLLHILATDGADPLHRLQEMSVEELMTIFGIGEAKAATIVAAVELGKRIVYPKPSKGTVVKDPAIAVAALSQDLMWQSQECFAAVLLDVQHRLIGTSVVSVGTATEALAHPRDVFRIAIQRGATRMIVAHNHPSGSLEPSAADLALTRQLLQAAQVLDFPILDHLILGAGQFCSLRATTNLWQEYSQPAS